MSAILFLYSQSQFFQQALVSLGGQGYLLSPKVKAQQTPQVLGEITTVENNYNYGTVSPDSSVYAQGAYAYDITNNKVIFEKDPHKQLQAASTVKIVTAAVALDKGQLNELITVGYFPTVVGESSMNLVFGEKYTLEDLLYGLLLVSGNDAAETIALGLAGKREIYITWMNEFAKKTGALDTNFTTPSGLDEDGQYTTAYDLAMMGKYVFSNYPLVLKISTTREKYLPKTDGHRAYLLRNKLQILDTFPLLGCKPGLGEEQMLSFVALLQKENRKILVSLIRTPSIAHDLTQILKTF